MTGEPLLAVVVRAGGHAPFSKRAAPLVSVLSGVLAPGDDVEIVRRSGAPASARVHSVTGGAAAADDEDRMIGLDGPAPEDLSVGDVLRRPGEAAPALAMTGTVAPARSRLLGQIRWVRFGTLEGPDAETFALLSDEGVVLFVERRLRRALGVHTSPFAMEVELLAAAGALETIGLVTDANRVRVTAAAALEGLGVAPSSATLANAAELGALAVTDASDRITDQAKGIGALLDLDILEGFASGYRGACEAAGQRLRLSLMEEGHAVALGWCRKCRGVARLDAELKCPLHHKKGQDVILALPEDAVPAEAWLAARRG